MDEISQRAIDKIDRELMDFMEQVLSENKKNTHHIANHGGDRQQRIIPRHKPPKRSLHNRAIRPSAALPRVDRYWVMSIFLILGALTWLKPQYYSGPETKYSALNETTDNSIASSQNETGEDLRPTKFDLYDRVEIPPRSHSL